MNKYLSLIVFTFLLVVNAFAYDFSAVSPSGHTLFYSYISKDAKTVNLTYEKSSDDPYETPIEGDLIIPGKVTYGGVTYTVTGVGVGYSLVRPFYNCERLTSVVIQEGVKEIGKMAFQGCTRIKSVSLPGTIESIGNSAFTSCGKLETINLPNSLTEIASSAFSMCSSLTSIEIPNTISIIDSYVFYYCSSLQSITIPASVTKISDHSFYYCTSLRSITIPSSVTEISKDAYSRSALKEIHMLPIKPPYLGENALPTTSDLVINVPCEALDAYKTSDDWSAFSAYYEASSHEISIASSNESYGSVTMRTSSNTCDDEFSVVLTASPVSDMYEFGSWSDGNTENPRTVLVSKDTTFTANFGEKPYPINISVMPPVCTSATGSVYYLFDGGVPPYSIFWSDGSTDNPRNEMLEGTYSLVAIDANGYSSDVIEVTLTSRDDYAPVITLNPRNPICESQDGEILTSVEEGFAPYSYQWAGVKETILFDFEKDQQGIFGGRAYSFNDNENGGNSEVTNSGRTEYGEDFPQYAMNLMGTLDKGDLNSSPSIGIGVDIQEDGSSIDCSVASGLAFYHKGDSVKVSVKTANITDYNYYSYMVPAHDDWELVSISWGDMVQGGGGLTADFDLSVVTGFQWIFEGETGKECNIWIDDVTLLDIEFEGYKTSHLKDRKKLPAGEYSLTVTDKYGCEDKIDLVLEKDFTKRPQVELEITNPICKKNNGEIVAHVSEGLEPYTYEWESVAWMSIADFENGMTTRFLTPVTKITDALGYADNSQSGIINDGAEGSGNSLQVVATGIVGNAYGYTNAGCSVTLLNGPIVFSDAIQHSYGISFYHKGDPCSLYLEVGDGYYYRVPSHSEWTPVIIKWEQDMGLDPEDYLLTTFSWIYRNGVEQAKTDIQFQIDNVNLLVYVDDIEKSTNQLTNLSEGVYKVSVEDANGCPSSDIVSLEKDESNKPVIVKEFSQAICGHDVGEIVISYTNGTEPMEYTWNDGDVSLRRSELAPGTYIFNIKDVYECENSDTTEIIARSFQYQPEIALATVSQEQAPYNLIVWQKEETQAIDHYNIYRENYLWEYEKIAEVAYEETGIYVDTKANSKVTSYKYKISATDYCGNESDLELTTGHRTLYLQEIQSMNAKNEYHLQWKAYEGIDFTTYYIYRITSDGVTAIDSVNAGITEYTDLTPPVGTRAYYVGIKLPKIIDINEPLRKAESGPFVIAISNVAEIENKTGVEVVEGTAAVVYAKDKRIVVECNTESNVVICNALGQTVVRGRVQSGEDKSFAVEAGVYIVIVGNKTFKVVVE